MSGECFTKVLLVSVEPVAQISNQLDVGVANAHVSRRRNTQQRGKYMRDHSVIKAICTQTHRHTDTETVVYKKIMSKLIFFRTQRNFPVSFRAMPQ